MVVVKYAHSKMVVNSVIREIVIYVKPANKGMCWSIKSVNYKKS